MNDLHGGLRALDMHERAVFYRERARREQQGAVKDPEARRRFRWVRHSS